MNTDRAQERIIEGQHAEEYSRFLVKPCSVTFPDASLLYSITYYSIAL